MDSKPVHISLRFGSKSIHLGVNTYFCLRGRADYLTSKQTNYETKDYFPVADPPAQHYLFPCAKLYHRCSLRAHDQK